MSTEVTGRWEELVSRPEFRGHRVKITIVDEQPATVKTDAWLESLRSMASNGVRITRSADDSRESIYEGVFAVSVHFSEDSLTVRLDDGRSLSVPLAWYPRLLDGIATERANYELIGEGEGIHWPELDEDISVEGLLAGRRSAESAASLANWRQKRQ